MKNRFTDCQTIEDAKTIFRAAAHSAHPDHGGSDEAFKILMKDQRRDIWEDVALPLKSFAHISPLSIHY